MKKLLSFLTVVVTLVFLSQDVVQQKKLQKFMLKGEEFVKVELQLTYKNGE